MIDNYDSGLEDAAMKDAPPVEDSIAIKAISAVEETPHARKISMVKDTTAAKKTSTLRRSTRIIPVAAPKVTKGYAKEIPNRAKSLDKAALFEKILRSKTNEPKIQELGLTPEEIEEDMLLMGITAASSSKAQAHPPTNLKSSMQQSSSSLTTPVASTSHQEISVPPNVERQARSRQLGKPLHCWEGCMRV
jgi:hypothetical protein